MKNKRNDLTEFEPEHPVSGRYRSDAVPLSQTSSLHIERLQSRMFGLGIFLIQK